MSLWDAGSCLGLEREREREGEEKGKEGAVSWFFSRFPYSPFVVAGGSGSSEESLSTKEVQVTDRMCFE